MLDRFLGSLSVVCGLIEGPILSFFGGGSLFLPAMQIFQPPDEAQLRPSTPPLDCAHVNQMLRAKRRLACETPPSVSVKLAFKALFICLITPR